MLQSNNLCIYLLVADIMRLIMGWNKINEQGGSAFDFEFGWLAHEGNWILESHFVDPIILIAALSHFQCRMWHRKLATDSPIAGTVHPDAIRTKILEHVNGPAVAAFGLRI